MDLWIKRECDSGVEMRRVDGVQVLYECDDVPCGVDECVIIGYYNNTYSVLGVYRKAICNDILLEIHRRLSTSENGCVVFTMPNQSVEVE